MPDAFKSRPDETAKLKRLVSRMNQEITSLTYQVEKLKTGLAGHRKARFGSKSGSLDQLALDLQDDEEIEAAAEARQAEQSSGDDDDDEEEEAASNKPRAKRMPTAPRCPIIWIVRTRYCRLVRIAARAVVPCARSARMSPRMSARISPRNRSISRVALWYAGSSAPAWPAPAVKPLPGPHRRRAPSNVAAPVRVCRPMSRLANTAITCRLTGNQKSSPARRLIRTAPR